MTTLNGHADNPLEPDAGRAKTVFPCIPTPAFTDDDFNLIKDVVYRRAGIFLKDSKKLLVSNRLRKRVIELGLPDFKGYCDILKGKAAAAGEIDVLIDCITTNETFFFREQKHFDVLNRHIFPEFARSRGGVFQLWSSGCSTGQEPYSIAIAALEFMERKNADFKLCVTASDICASALETAREGIYPDAKLKGLSPALIAKYFDAVPGGHRAAGRVRDMVVFKRMNLMCDRPAIQQHVVFCRNVMIYFDMEAQKRLISNLAASMREGAWLIVGLSESIHGLSKELRSERIEGAVVYRPAPGAGPSRRSGGKI